ncbi:MAG TPA: NUDIX hydrolase [Pyrinomonadaceae bacterium]
MSTKIFRALIGGRVRPRVFIRDMLARRMLKKLLGLVWRTTPSRLRRWSALLFQKRFTVSVGAVVVDDEGRVLLLKHVFRAGAGWGIPGGFVSQGEQPEAAIRRELLEETGLELEEAQFAFARTLARVNHVEIIFRCRPRGVAAARSLEINQLAWFAREQWPENLGRDQRYLIKRALDDGANEAV